MSLSFFLPPFYERLPGSEIKEEVEEMFFKVMSQ